jgi:hypothetical protein
MANKQIFELPVAPGLHPADQVLVSTANDNLTRRAALGDLPYQLGLPATVESTIASKLAEHVSVRDFGARGDGASDDTAAIAAALGSGVHQVLIPAGTYRVTAPLPIPPGTIIIGAGNAATTVCIDHGGHGLLCTGAEYLNIHVEGMRLELKSNGSGSGVHVEGNNVVLQGLRFAGGGAGAWAVDLDRCNDFRLSDLLMWGDGPDAFLANGIWLHNSTNAAVNYGDGTIAQLSIRLGSDNTRGLFFDGPTAVNQIINNILIAKANIIAPGRAGCRAVHIRNARRLTFVSLDIESIGEGVYEEGSATDRVECNQYIGVYAIGVATPYADSNGSVPRSVFNRMFAGCDNFPALPGFADGDALLQRGLWLGSWTSGQPLVRLVESGASCRIDKGGAAYLMAGPTSGNNSRVTCGVDGLTGPYDATLYLGDANIRRVSLDAPLHMFERTAVPPMAQDQMTVFADGATWNPGYDKGLYTRAAGAWARLLDTRSKGWVAVNEQTVASYTLQQGDLGDRVEMSGAAAKTVTVPAMATVPGTSGTKAPGATTIVTGRRVYIETAVTQVGTGPVTLAADAGVTLTGPTATNADGQTLILRWTGANSVKTRLN